MTLDYQTVINLLSQAIWPISRISGVMLIVPVFSSAMVPPHIKLLFIVSLSWICAQFIPPHFSFNHFNGLYLVYLAQELMLGLMMGFILQLVFQVFILGGQIISMQAGLGFAMMVDPSSQTSVPLISQLYLMMMTLIFLSLNGHEVVLETLIESFRVMPIGQVTLDHSFVGDLVTFSGWMFKEAVLVSIPATLSLLIVTLSFGIMARVTPQLNIFSLGFPITLIMGILILKVGLPSVGSQMAKSIDYGLQFIAGMFH